MIGNPLLEKSEEFSVRIVKLWRYLCKKKEFQMSVQIKKSGTSIGANATEAQYAQSKKDFVSKMHIALKECSETQYWLRVLHKSGLLNESEFKSIYSDSEELARLLSSIIITSKKEIDNKNNKNEDDGSENK